MKTINDIISTVANNLRSVDGVKNVYEYPTTIDNAITYRANALDSSSIPGHDILHVWYVDVPATEFLRPSESPASRSVPTRIPLNCLGYVWHVAIHGLISVSLTLNTKQLAYTLAHNAGQYFANRQTIDGTTVYNVKSEVEDIYIGDNAYHLITVSFMLYDTDKGQYVIS